MIVADTSKGSVVTLKARLLRDFDMKEFGVINQIAGCTYFET